MIEAQAKMVEFMFAAQQPCPQSVVYRQDITTKELRIKLMREELQELEHAINNDDIIEVADGLGDLLYVVLGTAVAYGINLPEVFDEIHRSNMTKFIDGYRRADGKWIKGPSYTPPNLAPILEAQSK